MTILGKFFNQNSDDFNFGDPAGYCVLAGKRSKQAKDKQTNKKRVCLVKSEVCDEISAFLSFSENLKIRVRVSTLGFSEPRKKRQKSI